MTNFVAIAESLAESGLAVLVWNVWTSRSDTKFKNKLDSRTEAREPLVVASMSLGNATKVVDILTIGMDELEERNKRLSEDLRDARGRLEETTLSQLDENARLRSALLEEQQEHSTDLLDFHDKLAQMNLEADRLRKQVRELTEIKDSE